MGYVSQLLFERWKGANQVGAAEPTGRVTVTRGVLDKGYGIGPGFLHIVDGKNQSPWQGFWRPTGEPKELPNLLSVKWKRDFSQKGTATATIEIENIIYEQVNGAGGKFHRILRGFLSPMLGQKIKKRPDPGWKANEWSEVLDNGYRIDVYEGYGDQQTHTFAGLIEESDFETQPDRVTITARDFGVAFTDQRIMGWNKPPEIKAPVNVADRKQIERQAAHDKEPIDKHYKGWCLINDVTDLAKQVFQWCGFQEFETENVGLSLNLPKAYTMAQFFSDILGDLESQLNYLFYMQSPTTVGESLGVPTFKHNTATDPAPRGMVEVRDSDLLESVKLKVDLSNLPYIIRYRGRINSDGVQYEEDTAKRFAATYFPPWSGAGPLPTEAGRTGGVRRHEVTIDEHLASDEECMAAAILAAIQYALQAFTAEVQISGYPGFELNEQVSIVDETTSVNSRMWIASIQSEHTFGAKATWKMTLGGALIDNLDMQQLGTDLVHWREIVKLLRKDGLSIAGELIY